MRVEFKCAGGEAAASSAPRRARGSGVRLVAALVDLADGRALLREHSERAWASVTFSGTRHEIVLDFAGNEAMAAGERLIAAVPEHEFVLPGQLVADVAVVTVEHVLLPTPRLTVRLEVLVLDER